MFEINYWALLGAAVANLVLGFVWYHPSVFGTTWMNLVGISPQSMEEGKKRMPMAMVGGLITAFIMAYVLAHFGIAWGVFDVIGAFELAFWIWLGFIATTQLGVVLWERRPWKLFLINTGYSLASLVVAAVILVLFG